MNVQVGPCPAEDMAAWSKFARRIVCELRTSPLAVDQVSSGMMDTWSTTLDEWFGLAEAAAAANRPFRWTSELEPEMVEFLLGGLDRCIQAPEFLGCCTVQDLKCHLVTTKMVVQSLVACLAIESDSCRHFVDGLCTSRLARFTD